MERSRDGSEQYIENARRVLANAERGIGTARIDKPCEACKFHSVGFLATAERANCNHPVVKLAASQADDGYGMKQLRRCGTQRGKRSPYGSIVCGPDAALFEDR